MAVSAAAMLLDELMGRDRNLAPTEKRREVRWDDAETCKYFLCGFCPHELFVNTRADLGPCDKIHDEDLKKGYAKSSRFERMGYEEEFMRFLQSLLADVERRIKRGHARLALNSNQGSGNAAGSTSREDQMDILTSRINDLVEEAEELGNEGKVEEAQSVMKLVEQMREERVGHEQADKKGKSREEEMAKKMEVCNVCGALLVAGDAQQRIDEHIMGKQHMGYARIRAYIEQRNSGVPSDETADLLLEREKVDREKQREDEKKRLEEEQERTREREQEREKERERDKERDKDRDRDRDRERRRSRSSSRSRRRRSRSGSKGRRDRDRSDRGRGDRDRSDRDRGGRDRGDRDRGDRRDRSRERRRRSRSRDKSRDKDRNRDRKRSRSRSRRSHSKSSSRRSSRDRDRERKRSRSRSKSRRSRSRSRDRKDKDRKSSRSSRDKDRDGDKRESSERSRHNGRDGEERSEKDNNKEHHGDDNQRGGSDVKSDGADGASPPHHHHTTTTNDTTTKSPQRETEGDSP